MKSLSDFIQISNMDMIIESEKVTVNFTLCNPMLVLILLLFLENGEYFDQENSAMVGNYRLIIKRKHGFFTYGVLSVMGKLMESFNMIELSI